MKLNGVDDYSINFYPDGGDLGRAPIRWIEPLEFVAVVPHVAYILECLHRLGNSRLPYKYAFEFAGHARKAIELAMMGIQLPENVQWYETDGLKIFQMRGTSGGVASNHICYLVTRTK